MSNNSKKYVINTYHPSPYTSGLADFMKGTVTLLRLLDNTDINVCVDYASHPIANFLHSKHTYEQGKPTDLLNQVICDSTVLQLLNACDQVARVTVNFCIWPFVLTKKQKQIIREMFQPKQEFLEYLNKQKEKLTAEYVTLHIRAGDLHMHSVTDVAKVFMPQIKRHVQAHDAQMSLFVACDNYEIKKELKKSYSFVHCMDSVPVHLGTLKPHADDMHKAVQDTLCDFYMMMGSKHTTCFSSYGAGSSFTHLCTEIYDVPCVFSERLDV